MNINSQWRIRRRMAIIAFVFGFVAFPAAYIKYPAIIELATHFYTLVTFVLTAYYGFATYHDVKSDEPSG